MKSTIQILVLLLFLSIISEAQNVKVEDYQVPISRAQILRLTANYDWSQTMQNDITNVTSNRGNANLLYRSFYSSLPYAWFLDVDATGGKSFADYTHDIKISPSIRKYVWDKRDWFGFASADIRHANTFNQVESYGTVGAGYGRYINATALAKAVRIEEHLIREDVIKGHLPKATMIEIANIIEREDEYRGIYGATYETKWYDDIEKAIKNADYLTSDSMGSIGILRTQQVLKGINERVSDRYFGWDLTAGVRFNFSSSNKNIDPSNPALTIGGRFAYPITWRSQINTYANAFTPMDSTFFSDVVVEAGIDYIYELSNKINWVNGYRMDYFASDNFDSFIVHNLTTSFLFYLENNIYLGINGSLMHHGMAPDRTDLGTSVSLQYNLF